MPKTAYTSPANTFKKFAFGAALAIASFSAVSAAMAYSPAPNQVIQTIATSSAAGSGTMTQIVTRNTQSPSLTRVCLVNHSRRAKVFTHAVPHINALRARPVRGKSCANFPSNARVHFALFDDGQPVKASVNMVMSLSAFAGGLVTFVWK